MIIKEYREQRSDRNAKMIELSCDTCDEVHSRTLKHYKKMKKNNLFDLDYCNKCWRTILNNRPEYRKKLSESAKLLSANSEYRNKMSDSMKLRMELTGYPLGDLNPMKRKDVRDKVGKTRSERMNESEREKYRIGTINAWKDGKFIGVPTHNCKWYDYRSSSGSVYKVQGTWEYKFIKWLDENNLKFKCHRDRISYIMDGKERFYYPDFYVYEWKCYVDVKSEYYFRNQREKFDILKRSSDIPIKLLFKKDLINLGIRI